jgi:hypothetical protein
LAEGHSDDEVRELWRQFPDVVAARGTLALA